MSNIPENIDVESLPGPKRGSFPALYFQDECIYSPDKKHFALAYTITEASMGNDVGCVAWGMVQGGQGHILQNLVKLHASCWQRPWCKWFSNDVFVFKSQHYANNSIRVPLVAIHIDQGYSVLPDSNETDIWLPENMPSNIAFKKYNEADLIKEICNA